MDKCQPLLTPHQNLLFSNQVRRTIRLKHMSRRTEKSYIHYILDYIYFHKKKDPEDMGAEEIGTYLSHLATDKEVAASTQNIALSALLFLYRQVLKVDLPYKLLSKVKIKAIAVSQSKFTKLTVSWKSQLAVLTNIPSALCPLPSAFKGEA